MNKLDEIKAVVNKTIALADREGFAVKFINEGMSTHYTTILTTRTEMIEHATVSDECWIVFWDGIEQFSMFFDFDNDHHEMIYDHTDNEVANAVASEVHDYFLFN